MRSSRTKLCLAFAIVPACILILAGSSFAARAESTEASGEEQAQTGGDEDRWDFLVAPYINLPSMSGTAGFGPASLPIDTTIGDLFTGNDFVFGLQAQMEAWYKRRWGGIFNGTWIILKQEDRALPGPGSEVYDLKVNTGYFEFFGAWDPFGERRFKEGSEGPTWDVQALVGLRVTTMHVNLDVSGSPLVELTENWVDPLLGARGRVRFGPDNRWSAISRVDFGGFGAGSDWTWNFVGMFGYDFHIKRLPCAVTLGVRGFGQDYESGSGASLFKWDVTQWGPILGFAMFF